MYSVMYANVRMAETESFTDAVTRLVSLMRERMRDSADLRNSARFRRELEAAESLSLMPRDGYAGVSEWDWIYQGRTGLGASDLALLHEYSNGSRDYTIDVPCKVLEVVAPSRVRIRITGESLQLVRYSERTVPASFLRNRGH